MKGLHKMAATPRDRRLANEFRRMRDLVGPHSLFDFLCNTLSTRESIEYLKRKMSAEVIKEGFSNFLPLKEFVRIDPNAIPEKYLVIYRCHGLKKDDSGEVVVTQEHAMSVVYGLDYPSRPPVMVWMTPIWHPNFQTPYICPQGRPFAAGWTLDQIVLAVGKMIQYRNYNLDDPLNYEAAEWVRRSGYQFPVDDRDLVDSTRRLEQLRNEADPCLIELVRPQDGADERLLEILE